MTEPARVRLALPGAAEFFRVARVATAMLARQEGFTVREVDELQRVVGDRLRDILERAPVESRVELLYDVTPGEIAIEVGLITTDATATGPREAVHRRRTSQPV